MSTRTRQRPLRSAPAVRRIDPRPGRRPGSLLWTGVAFLAALGIGIVGTDLARSEDSTSPSTPRTATPAASSTPDLEHGTLRWVDFAGLQLPVSATHGPRCLSGLRAACFSRDEAGAALAAVHVLVRTFAFAGPGVFTPTIAEQVVGPGQAQLARETSATYRSYAAEAGVRGEGPIRGEAGSIAGYRTEPAPSPRTPSAASVSPSSSDAAVAERVVVVLVKGVGEAGAPVFTEYRVGLVWVEGDWRVIAPPWGDWSGVARVVSSPDPATYISYDAVGAS
ncbi:MAG: hypothetical protein IPK24_07400 [Kineosporiaceae bacterium]|nr:hypothetical protein [Kineosporiaceae bacterium]